MDHVLNCSCMTRNRVDTESKYPVHSRFFGSFDQAEIWYLSINASMNVHMQVLNVLVQLMHRSIRILTPAPLLKV
jgi:hypothetical protein